jgi:broad specificity phosphatase PhoE
LETQLKAAAAQSITVDFFRHAKTANNDGSFLGIGRNPDIEMPLTQDFATEKYERVYSSQLRRAIATAARMQADERMENELLNEINYGQAEGMMITDLQNAYPEIIAEWDKGNDPPFPAGENQMDVAKRLQTFVQQELSNNNKQTIAVVTHNVVLRILLGNTLGLPLHKWHQLPIAHLQKLPFQVILQHLLPNFGQQERILLRNQICEINNHA